MQIASATGSVDVHALPWRRHPTPVTSPPPQETTVQEVLDRLDSVVQRLDAARENATGKPGESR